MNTFGRIFRVGIFGESHGCCTGVCIDGCPAGIAISEDDFEHDLSRRRSGAKGTTPRREADLPRIMSGVFNGFTTGSPVLIEIANTDTVSKDYSLFRDIPRPGHADFTAGKKYRGFADHRGSGHFSGRLTAGLVTAGVIAKKIIAPVVVESRILEIGGSADWADIIEQCINERDSVGGIVECTVSGTPAGWGEPFFDSVESVIAHIIYAVPAVKGIEFGAGFAAARMRGSDHNDAFAGKDGATVTNHAGGINGGITNGNPVIFRVAVKPASSIARPQATANLRTGETVMLETPGRHDACITLRVPPVLEAAAAIALADLKMIYQAQQ
ncbi:MAG: chorismate synthase [Bacteroidales bacterium]|jgi:chorismate synthase|nr:chorismate synthase [Bacteroidales bacterium]